MAMAMGQKYQVPTKTYWSKETSPKNYGFDLRVIFGW